VADPITQAKHTARVRIGEASARRLAGHGFWCMFSMAQSARRRAASLLHPPPALPIQPELFA
jgi:hypothetical protein